MPLIELIHSHTHSAGAFSLDSKRSEIGWLNSAARASGDRDQSQPCCSAHAYSTCAFSRYLKKSESARSIRVLFSPMAR